MHDFIFYFLFSIFLPISLHFLFISFQIRVNAENLFIGKTPIDRLLTADTFQEIKGNVTIHGNILVSNRSNVEIDNLFTNNTIFGFDLQSLLDDCYVISPNETVVVSSNKWFRNLTVDKIIVEGDFWQLNQSTAEIVQRLDDLRNGIRLQGNQIFTLPMSINNLTVTDFINDIPSSSFGKNWLLLEGKQVRFLGNEMKTSLKSLFSV